MWSRLVASVLLRLLDAASAAPPALRCPEVS